MRDAERARDLTEAGTFVVHPERFALIRTPETATLGFADQLLKSPYLSLRGSLRFGIVEELGRTRATMIVCTHVA